MKMSSRLIPQGQNAFSIIELLVVVLIIGILSSMAAGVYINQVQRARFAACWVGGPRTAPPHGVRASRGE